MNPLKSTTLLGIGIVLLTGTLSHFVYDWTGKTYIVGFFTPVSESIWEHMKLLFFPMLLFSFFMKRKLQQQYPCVGSSLMAGILLGTISIPVIFYTYSGILGYHTLVLDLLTFVAAVLIAFIITYRLAISCKAQDYSLLLYVGVSLFLIGFFVFTYHPPAIGVFAG